MRGASSLPARIQAPDPSPQMSDKAVAGLVGYLNATTKAFF